jgi:S-adenosylmethionine-diacylglycerol 3-amino-3-carboxypropyl transferase
MANVSERAAFSFIRYAQCWEDADTLLAALNVQCGGHYISIASGGENSFSILSQGGQVTAVDLSLPQLSVTDLKRASYLALDYEAFLAFLGVHEAPAGGRLRQYERLKEDLSGEHRQWLDQNLSLVERGIIHCGRFESYFKLFRTRVLPLTHGKRTVEALLCGNPDKTERGRFCAKRWNTRRYRLLFHFFFSRFIMGRLGRDTSFFKYVEGSVAERIMERVNVGLTEVDGPQNPYLQYILTGNFGNALPHALRKENFAAIKANIGGLRLIRSPLEEAIDALEPESAAGFNLSDIFEYMPVEHMSELYERLLSKAASGGRFAYWNMLAPRTADPDRFAGRIRTMYDRADELHKRDKAFFYSRFVIEEKI